MDLKEKIRVLPDYPREGISYKDLSTLLRDAKAYRYAVQSLARQCEGMHPDLIVCAKASSLMIGAPLAYILGSGLVMVRRSGQLVGDVFSWNYAPDFGGETREMHRDAVAPGQRVLVVDELLATGGNTLTAIKLVEQLGGIVVGTAFLAELTGLGGRYKLKDYDTISLVQYNY